MPQADAVFDALGNFGPWQAGSLFIIALVKVPAAWQMMSILFLAPSPETLGGTYFCARPADAENWTAQDWIERWHPKDKMRVMGFNPCYVFKNETNSTELRECTNFEFIVNEPTMVTQWSLVCSRYDLVNVVQFFYLLGIFLGGIFTFLLLKKISPRAVILLGAALQVAAGIALALQPIYEVHCLLKFLIGLSACIMFSAAFQIIMDVSFGWQKIVLGVCYEHFWSIGVLTMGWLSELAGSWRELQLIITIPTALFLFLFWVIPDSPRWLIANGHLEQAENLLRSAAGANGRKLPPNFTIQKSPSLPIGEAKPLPKLKIFCLQLIWISNFVAYYGGLLNYRSVGATSLPRRTTIAGGAEIIGTSIGLLLLLRPRFKFCLMGVLLVIGGACCVASWAIEPNDIGSRGGWPMVFLAVAGRISIATSVAVMTNGGTAEFIPLPKRPFTIMALLTGGRLFLLSAPFLNTLAVYGESVTLCIYGGLLLMAGFSALYLSAVSEFEEHSLPNLIHTSNIWNVEIEKRPPEDEIVCTNINPCFVDDHMPQGSYFMNRKLSYS